MHGDGAAVGGRVMYGGLVVMGARLAGARVSIGGKLMGDRVGGRGHGSPTARHMLLPSLALQRQLPSAQHWWPVKQSGLP